MMNRQMNGKTSMAAAVLLAAGTLLFGRTADAKESVFFVGAHPDDTEGYAATAFLLKERYDVHVVDLTRGELGLGMAGLKDGSTARRRMAEEAKACAFLGATPHFLDEVDGFACAGEKSVDRLAGLFRQHRPKAVFTHWPVDEHVDHVQCWAVVANALRKSGLEPERYFFEVLLSQTRNFRPIYRVDVSSTISNKVEMLRCYECQNVNDGLAKEKLAQAALRGRETVPPVAAAEVFTTFDGKPIPGGVLEGLSETREDAYDGIVRRVAAADAERAARQAKLARRASLADYRDRVVSPGGTNVWTRALQAALDANEIVIIPASDEPYLIDGVVRIPSGRRIEAKGATVALLPGVRTLMLRNANCPDGTLKPVAGRRDDNIAVVGGRWEDWTRKRAGYGATGRFDMSERRHGNWFGVSTLFYFGNCDHVTVEGVTFAHTSGFAVQAGDGDAHGYADIAFDDCYADGLHLNGNLTRVHAKNVRGKVGDDLVALNAYDWLNSSVNFGPQRDVLCEDLELVLKDGKGYPAIRIQPAKYKYADGSVVDCAVSDVIFRRVKGIVTFKMYLQTPGYTLGKSPEWAEVGSGGNLWFEDIEIDLTHPIDNFGQYATSDPLRGHFGAFEFGANLTSVNFRNIDIRFHLDKWPLAHLAVVGPKSLRLGNYEVFDPYVSCRVGRVSVEGLTVRGRRPEELVRATVFDDVNGDGRSSGRGVIEKLEL